MPIVPDIEPNIAIAADLLKAGEVVAFPTETVYGLGANALNSTAVDKIYARKGRPSTNPLIVHVSSVEMAKSICHWNELAQQLADIFWPGPLTIVLPKRDEIPDNVSAGLNTVGVRIPANTTAQKLIAAAGLPLAAPSANKSNEISPTSAAHVQKSLGEHVFILDGGDCEIGLESTVLDLSVSPPVILRPGQIGERQLSDVIGELGTVEKTVIEEEAAPSPGMSRRHYAPKAKVHVFGTMIDAIYHKMALGFDQKVGIIAFAPTKMDGQEIILPNDANEYAQRFYATLHALDEAECELILIEAVPLTMEWNAVRDRIARCAAQD
jgi:L-threonylcarbamoyladenylate synthase